MSGVITKRPTKARFDGHLGTVFCTIPVIFQSGLDRIITPYCSMSEPSTIPDRQLGFSRFEIC